MDWGGEGRERGELTNCYLEYDIIKFMTTAKTMEKRTNDFVELVVKDYGDTIRKLSKN